MLHMHSGLRWVVLLLAVAAIFNAYLGLTKGYRLAQLKKISLFFMISFDIQVVIGLYLYYKSYTSGIVKTALESGEMMSNAAYRFWTVEHIFGMILSLIFVHLGYSVVKKGKDNRKVYKKALLYFGLALLIVIATIPWPFREAIGRAMF